MAKKTNDIHASQCKIQDEKKFIYSVSRFLKRDGLERGNTGNYPLCLENVLKDFSLKTRRALTPVEKKCFSIQILLGLSYLQTQHIIHFDMKRSNLAAKPAVLEMSN